MEWEEGTNGSAREPVPGWVPAEGQLFPKTPQEWAQILFSSLTLSFGLPANLYALHCNLRRLKAASRGKGARANSKAREMVMLLLNLNIADLLILCVYLPTQIAWKNTTEWHGGEFLCRFLRFMHQFCFHLSSYTVVSIATERLLTVRRSTIHAQKRLIKALLVAAWLVSVAFSVPTFVCWSTVQPFKQFCTTVFMTMAGRGSGWAVGTVEKLSLAYSTAGILTVFWLPAVYISVAYAHIFAKLWAYGRAGAAATLHGTPVLVKTPCDSGLLRVRSEVDFDKLESSVSPPSASPTPSSVHTQSDQPILFRRKSQTFTLGSVIPAKTPKAKRSEDNLLRPPRPRLERRPSSFHGVVSARQDPATAPAPTPKASLAPKWRRQLRSKSLVFTKTGLLVLVYLASWLPYFAAALISPKLKVLEFLIALNAALDPLIYAFD